MVLLSDDRPCHLRAGYLMQKRFPGLVSRWWVRAHAQAITMAVTRAAAGRALGKIRDWLVRPHELALGGSGQAHQQRSVARMLRMVLHGNRGIGKSMFGHELARLHAAATVAPVRLGNAGQVELAAELAALAPYFLVSFGQPLPPAELLRHTRGLVIHAQLDTWPAQESTPDSMTSIDAAPHARPLHDPWRMRPRGASIHIVDPLTGARALARRSTVTLHADDTAQHRVLASMALAAELLLEVLANARTADELIVFPCMERGHEARLVHSYLS